MASASSQQEEIEELQAKVMVLEHEVANLHECMAKINKILDFNKSDGLEKYKKGEVKTLNTIISSIGKGMITRQQYSKIEQFSDLQVYVDAEWFRNQVVSAFSKLYFNIKEESCDKELSFDEVKKHLGEMAEMTDTTDVFLYMKVLKIV